MLLTTPLESSNFSIFRTRTGLTIYNKNYMEMREG
jgi:hypothetical protein